MDEIIVGLLKCNGIGPVSLKRFLTRLEYNTIAVKNKVYEYYNNIDKDIIYENIELAKKEIDKQKEKGINIITVFNKKFPEKLINNNIPILYLYYKGNIDLLNKKNIAVIGTREPSKDSRTKTKEICDFFIDNGYNIVSGLAKGIDTFAHLSCLESNGKTIAVLPSDLEIIQPSSNKQLAKDILINKGCLISEYPIETKVNKYNFVMRDRIVSALSDFVIVIEASEKSGTMSTVHSAIKNDIGVFWLNKPLNINDKHIINLNLELNDLGRILNLPKCSNVNSESYNQQSFFS